MTLAAHDVELEPAFVWAARRARILAAVEAEGGVIERQVLRRRVRDPGLAHGVDRDRHWACVGELKREGLVVTSGRDVHLTAAGLAALRGKGA